jgi:hypothetical protein
VAPIKILPATIGVLAILAAVPAQAGVARGPREVVQTDYTTTRRDAPSGSIYDVVYRNPKDPHANPPAVRRVLIDSPAGARIRTSVPERCAATDQEFQMRGEAACPPRSKVGRGDVTISVLGGPPTTSQISVFNTAGGVVQLVKFGSFGAAAVRTKLKGADADTRIPTCLTGGQPPKGCPSDQAVVLASRIVLWKVVRGGRAYIETPPKCPRKGWRTRVTYHYGDGKVESVASRGACRRKRPG